MSRPVKLKRVQRGEAIRAEDWNTVASVVEALSNVRGGAGLTASFGIDGLLIALTGGLKNRFVWCKITAAPPPGVPILPSDCKYSYKGLDAKIDEVDKLPVYGRQVENDEAAVYPAKGGHLCFVFRNPQADGTKLAELGVLTESPARGPCGGQFRS